VVVVDVDKFKLEIPLTRVSHPSAHYHPKAFIQKGPIKGSGLGMYLANGTEVYIVTDDTPPSYEHLTGYYGILYVIYYMYVIPHTHVVGYMYTYMGIYIC